MPLCTAPIVDFTGEGEKQSDSLEWIFLWICLISASAYWNIPDFPRMMTCIKIICVFCSVSFFELGCDFNALYSYYFFFEIEPSLYQISSDTSYSPLLLESSIIKLRRLCKFCDERATSCQGKRTCKVECEITSICPDKQDVCVTIWCVSAGHTHLLYFQITSLTKQWL